MRIAQHSTCINLVLLVMFSAHANIRDDATAHVPMVAVATAEPAAQPAAPPAAPLVTRFNLLDNSSSSSQEEAPPRAARPARERRVKVLDDFSSSSSEEEAPAHAARRLPARRVQASVAKKVAEEVAPMTITWDARTWDEMPTALREVEMPTFSLLSRTATSFIVSAVASTRSIGCAHSGHWSTSLLALAMPQPGTREMAGQSVVPYVRSPGLAFR